MQGLGADHVVDYKTQDYTSLAKKFDIVFDAVGKTTRSKAKRIMKREGKYVSVNMMTQEKEAHLQQLKQMAEEGHLKPLIDSCYTLDQIVEAHQYVDQGHKKGNVVIEIET